MTSLRRLARWRPRGLLLTGCAGAAPGVAAQVGDETISMQRGRRRAPAPAAPRSASCEPRRSCRSAVMRRHRPARCSPLGAPRSTPTSTASTRGTSLLQQRGRRAAGRTRLAKPSGSDRDDLRRGGQRRRALAAVARPGRRQAVASRQGTAGADVDAGRQGRQQASSPRGPDDHDVEIDPQLRPRSVDGQAVPVDTSSSVAVGDDRAKAGVRPSPTQAYADALPDRATAAADAVTAPCSSEPLLEDFVEIDGAAAARVPAGRREQTHRSLARYLLEETARDARGDRHRRRPDAPPRGARRPAAPGLLPRRDRRGVRHVHHRRRRRATSSRSCTGATRTSSATPRATTPPR